MSTYFVTYKPPSCPCTEFTENKLSQCTNTTTFFHGNFNYFNKNCFSLRRAESWEWFQVFFFWIAIFQLEGNGVNILTRKEF
jgi:hypothetical protein